MKSAEPTSGPSPLLREGIDWTVRGRSGAFGAQEQAELSRWRAQSPDHDAAYRDATALGQIMREVGREMLDERARGEAVVLPFARPEPRRAPVATRRGVMAGAMAASLAGAFFAGRAFDLFGGGRQPDFATATGERRTVALAAGLALELDAKTSIAVDPKVRSRVELLSGRAEVRADSQVTLRAGKGVVMARGARFDVRLDDTDACVTCLQGEVTLAYGDARLALGPGEQVTYDDSQVGARRHADPSEVAAWKEGRLVFHEAPLSDVVREMNRYREGRVVLASGAVGRRPVNGVFYTARIDDAIAQIEQITGAHALRLPGDLIVLS